MPDHKTESTELVNLIGTRAYVDRWDCHL